MAPRKKTAIAAKSSKTAKTSKTSITAPSASLVAALPPSRVHDTSYHYPLLLSGQSGCDALLSWFSGVAETRSMPWRKKWIDPDEYEDEEELGRVLSKRAYEVWVSEVSKYAFKCGWLQTLGHQERVNALSRVLPGAVAGSFSSLFHTYSKLRIG